jgi:hypothetical protein
MAGGIFYDDRGFTVLQTTDRAGDWQDATVSDLIQPILDQWVTESPIVGSQLLRRKNIYRMFLADGRYFSIGFRDRKVVGIMLCDLGIAVNTMISEEDSTTGRERLFFGETTGGFVYEMEKGTNFAGSKVSSFIRLAYNHNKSPSAVKKYVTARLDAVTASQLTLFADFDYDLGQATYSNEPTVDMSSPVPGGIWDTSRWEGFVWDEIVEGVRQEELNGEGVNIGVSFNSNTAIDEQHTLRGLLLRYKMRHEDRRTA